MVVAAERAGARFYTGASHERAQLPHPRIAKIPPEQYFAARAVVADADVRGLVAFHFACFSAGTPELDAFSRAVGEKIPRRTDAEFVAALPRRLDGGGEGHSVFTQILLEALDGRAYVLRGKRRRK